MTSDAPPLTAEDGVRPDPADPGAVRAVRRAAPPDAEQDTDCEHCEPRVLCALCGARLCD